MCCINSAKFSRHTTDRGEEDETEFEKGGNGVVVNEKRVVPVLVEVISTETIELMAGFGGMGARRLDQSIQNSK